MNSAQRHIVAYLDGLDLSPRPSLKGRELVAQGLSFSPLGETGERLGLSALAGAIKKEW
jgi:hypothetical protein